MLHGTENELAFISSGLFFLPLTIQNSFISILAIVKKKLLSKKDQCYGRREVVF